MSLSNNYVPTKISGDGATTVFTTAWKGLASAYVKIAWEDKTTGVQTTKVVGVDCSLTFLSDGRARVDFAGGSAPATPPNTVWVVIYRQVTPDQTFPYKTSQGFQGQNQENSYDKLTAIAQDILDTLKRVPTLAVGTTIGGLPITGLSMEGPNPGKALIWNEDGDALINSTTSFEDVIATAEAFADDAEASAIAAAASETNALAYANASAASALLSAAAAGFTYNFLTNTVDSDPGAGNLKFNNANLALATELYISETTALAQAIAAEIATWDDSTSTIRGKLRIFKQSNPAVFATFNVTGTETDAGAYDKITVAYVTGSGAFANTDPITVQFIRNGDKGDTGATGSTGATGPTGPAGANGAQLRNFVLNGGFNVWQRGTTFQLTGSGAVGYCADRWFMSQNGAAGANLVTRATDNSFNTLYRLQVQRIAGQTDVNQQRIGQVFETIDSIGLQNKDVTLSFYGICGANFSATSALVEMAFAGGTGTDQGASALQGGTWTGQASLGTIQANLTTSWQRFTLTIPAATMGFYNQYGFYFRSTPTGTAGAADWWAIKNVQIEANSAVSAFVVEPFGLTLERCKRFYQKTFPYATAPAQNTGNTAGTLSGNANGTTNGTAVFIPWRFGVQMRTTPSFTTYNPSAANANLRNITAGADLAVGVTDACDSSAYIVNAAVAIDNNLYRIHAAADAEF